MFAYNHNLDLQVVLLPVLAICVALYPNNNGYLCIFQNTVYAYLHAFNHIFNYVFLLQMTSYIWSSALLLQIVVSICAVLCLHVGNCKVPIYYTFIACLCYQY